MMARQAGRLGTQPTSAQRPHPRQQAEGWGRWAINQKPAGMPDLDVRLFLLRQVDFFLRPSERVKGGQPISEKLGRTTDVRGGLPLHMGGNMIGQFFTTNQRCSEADSQLGWV